MQRDRNDNRPQLSWVYRIDPRLRAAAIFCLVAGIALAIAARDGQVDRGMEVLLAVYAGLFVLYLLFRFGYFAERVLMRIHGDDRVTVHKMRSTQGGRRFTPSEAERLISADEAHEELRGEDRVVGIELNGHAVAFPNSAMALREVANFEIGGERVAVSWWAVSYAARGFRRRTRSGHAVTLEPVAKTIFNSAVYRDESEDGRWVQFLGQAVSGECTGESLEQIPVLATNWSAWSSAYPDTEALSTAGTPEWDIFERYYFNDRPGLHREGARDRRLPNKEIVLGVVVGDAAKAYPYRSLIEEPLVHEEVGREPVIVLLERISATAAAFSRIVAGRVLTFEAASDNPHRPELVEGATIVPDENRTDGEVGSASFEGEEQAEESGPQIEYEPLMLRDRETGSLWRALTGQCVEGELAGQEMRMLNGQTGFWFVWSRFYPQAELLLLPDESEA